MVFSIPNLIVPVLNRYDLLDRMLATIDYPVEHLLIIDNGSGHNDDEGQLHIPPQVEHTTYLPMPSNLGVSGSWNLGIKLFPQDDRWTFASNDMYFKPGELMKLAEASTSDLTLIEAFPHWHAFTIGQTVVEKVGLFDEALYPAYFEDNDYERRCKHHDITITYLNIDTHHDNSSTINSDSAYRFRNSTTFQTNRKYYDMKQRLNDYTSGSWQLTTRRENDWDGIQ